VIDKLSAWAEAHKDLTNLIIASMSVVSALAAVFALLEVRQQGKDNAKVMESARDAFVGQTYPLVKFVGYGWGVQSIPGVADKEVPLDCAHPAHGIVANFQNVSNTVVYVLENDVKLFMGDRPIDATPERSVGKVRRVVTRGDGWQHGMFPRTMPETFARLEDAYREPFLKMEVRVVYQALPAGKCYLYQSTVEVHYSCKVRQPPNFANAEKPPSEVACPEGSSKAV